MNSPTQINLRLEVINGNKIMVPGNEPIGESTSRVLAFQWRGRHPLANLDDVLAAIPGSFVLFGDNWGGTNSGIRKKWLVLPSIDQTCPCTEHPDYYQIIRDLAKEETEVEERFDHCNTIGQGYCPSPDWDSEPPPPVNPYRNEGDSLVGGTGVLPPVPPWTYKH